MLQIDAGLHKNGFVVTLNKRQYKVVYPESVWHSFSPLLRQTFAETASYFFTYHFALANKKLSYQFPPPALQSFFFHAFVYSYPEMVIEFPEEKFKTSVLLKQIFNAGFNIGFVGLPHSIPTISPHFQTKKNAVMAFSFGKDSLLTFAVARELGLTVYPFFFVEPTSPYENTNKLKLIKEFYREFNVRITPLEVTLGGLRQARGLMLGWDLILTQYTLLLVPYLHAFKASHFFWSNEKSTDERETDKEGYTINPTFEQSVEWILHLNNLLRPFGSNAKLQSLIAPLHELGVLYTLHKRYPEIGKYQLSCFNDSRRSQTRKWCGVCYECARVYLFLMALGVDPKQVGFQDNMLAASKKKLHFMLDAKNSEARDFDILFQSYDERLLAYYLVYKRGIKGPLINLFVKMHLKQVERRKYELVEKYARSYEVKTISPELSLPIQTIFREEMTKFKAEITALI